MAYKPQVGAQMAAPNVIPMADIMLVLLIIFMVVTPMLQKTHQVDLASVNDPRDMKDADKDDAIVVAVTRDGSLYPWQHQDQEGRNHGPDQGPALPTSWTRPSTSRATRAPSMATSSPSWTKFVPPAWTLLALLTEKTKALGGPSTPPPRRSGGRIEAVEL